MSQPSNLKVKRLDELPLLPAELAGEASTYAVVGSADYQLNAGVLAEAAAEGVLDELIDLLAPVAISNSYNDLDDKPFIPQDSDDLPQGSTNLYATAAEKSKLSGIEAGAQVNTVTSVAGKTGAVTLVPSDVGAEPTFSKGSIIAGEGVSIAGTLANRLVGSGDITITATGEGGGVVVEVLAGDGIAVDSTDVASPVVSLTSAAQDSLALADTAVQPTDLSTVATTGSYSDLADAPTGSTSIVLSGGQWQRAAVIGDVTLSANSNTATIANNAVTNAKMSSMAAGTIKGRASGAGSGSPTDLSAADVRAILNVADGAQVNVPTNLSQGTATTTTVDVNSSTGTAATLTAATTSVAGVMTAADKIALNGKANDSDVVKLTGNQTVEGIKNGIWQAESAGPIGLSADNRSNLEAIAQSGTDGAFMTFHRPGSFAAYLGVDVDNILKFGGWSLGSAAHTIWHSGNLAVGTSGDAVGKLNTANTWSGLQTHTGGVSLGSTVVASPTDLSKHVALYGTSYGVSVTTNTINVVTDGGVAATFSSTGFTSNGAVSDAGGNVRKMVVNVANASGPFMSSQLNEVVEKTDGGAYSWTIPSGLGSHGDAITVVNSQGAGNITVVRGSGVELYRNGVNADIVVVPGSMVTIYRSGISNRWIA